MVKNLPERQETRVQFLGWEVRLEKVMATHSSILAWRIPCGEEPGGLQSVGLQSWTWLTHTQGKLKVSSSVSWVIKIRSLNQFLWKETFWGSKFSCPTWFIWQLYVPKVKLMIREGKKSLFSLMESRTTVWKRCPWSRNWSKIGWKNAGILNHKFFAAQSPKASWQKMVT